MKMWKFSKTSKTLKFVFFIFMHVCEGRWGKGEVGRLVVSSVIFQKILDIA